MLILGILAFLSLLVAMATPLLDLCYYLLPGLSVGSPKRVLILYTIPLAALAAFGMEQFLHGGHRGYKRITSALFIALGLSGFYALTWGFPSFSAMMGEAWKARAAAMEVKIPEAAELEAVFLYLRKVSWPVVFALLLFGFAQIVTIPWTRNMLPSILILAFAIGEAGLFGRGFITFQDGEGQYPSTRTTRFLQEAGRNTSPFRIASFGASEFLGANMAAVHGIQCVGGISGLVHRRYGELIHELEPETIKMHDPRFIGAFKSSASLSSPVLDLLGVRYIAVGRITDAPLMEEAGFRLVHRSDEEGIGLFENPEALPRGFVVTRCETADRTEALSRITDLNFDPSSLVILEDPLPEGFTLAPDPEGRVPEVRVTEYQPLRIAMEVKMHRARGFLVLTDAFLPGWNAFVDGAPVDVYCADYAFRAVPLEGGNHEVLYRYEPSSRTLGLLGSALCLAILLCWGILLGWKAIALRRTS
jgi:hypothetical protein